MTALLLGAGLAWPLPLLGILLAVVASFGLVIAWEGEMSGAVLTPAATVAVLPMEDPRPSA
jgi:hypothetical protein